jgi:hypothetical protein
MTKFDIVLGVANRERQRAEHEAAVRAMRTAGDGEVRCRCGHKLAVHNLPSAQKAHGKCLGIYSVAHPVDCDCPGFEEAP